MHPVTRCSLLVGRRPLADPHPDRTADQPFGSDLCREVGRATFTRPANGGNDPREPSHAGRMASTPDGPLLSPDHSYGYPASEKVLTDAVHRALKRRGQRAAVRLRSPGLAGKGNRQWLTCPSTRRVYCLSRRFRMTAGIPGTIPGQLGRGARAHVGPGKRGRKSPRGAVHFLGHGYTAGSYYISGLEMRAGFVLPTTTMDTLFVGAEDVLGTLV